MRRTKIYLVTAAALLALAGCDHALEPAGGGAITIEASVGPMTKVTYDGAGSAFAAGDRVAVYAWTGTAAEIPASRAVDGVVNTFDGSKWTPASLMRWQTMSTPHFFLGVSPAPGAAVADLTAVPYTLDPSPDKYAASDLLLATNFGTDGAGVKPSQTAVPLAFDHAMAKLVVNLKFRSQWAAVPAVSAVTVTAKSAATVNYLTKSVTASGTAAPLALPAAAAVSGYDKSFSSLQVPQGGVRRITVSIDGTDFVYEATEDIPLVSGEITTVCLNVGRDRIELGSVTINDWDAEAEIPDADLGPQDVQSMPLTIEATEAGAQVTFTFASIVKDGSVQYRIWDGKAWSDWVAYPGGTIVKLAAAGDKLQLRGDNAAYAAGSDYSNILFDKDCYVYGNIMSLITSTGFSTATELTGSMTFAFLFKANDHLKSHASIQLLLPATTLAASCYYYMFAYCAGLTTAPALPATTLAEDCYYHMFYGCTNLITVPALPAMTLAGYCYVEMFNGCTSLTTAPALPATTLAEYCYSGMFKGCTSLTTAPALPATTLAEYCYNFMFYGCTSLTTAPALPATTLAKYCYNFMFYGCTSLTAAPALPAETLAEYCYYFMFDGCSSLTAAPALPATTLAKDCYHSMFNGCTSLTMAPALPATTLADFCYSGMFGGCTSLTKAPALPATTLANYCYQGMFGGCTSLTKAPALPATTLASFCYNSMFYGCPQLNSVTCLATDIPADYCTYSWLCNAGTADGCERKLYVDPSMLTDPNWNLGNSGTDGKRWTVATNDYAHLTSANIGNVLAADGNIYADAAAATAAGTTAQAVIAYVGSVPNYFDKFLAIAMEDVDDLDHGWTNTQPFVGTFAGSHAVTIGATTYDTNALGDTYYDQVVNDVNTSSATRTTGVVKGWRLPSVTDWRYIFDGLGRQKAGLTLTAKNNDGSTIYSSNATPTDPLGIGAGNKGMYYCKDGDAIDASSLRAAINAACGNTALQSDGYWSSSGWDIDDPELNACYEWSYVFTNGMFDLGLDSFAFFARAVFAY